MIAPLLERAALLRGTVTDGGYGISGYAADETHRVVVDNNRTVIEVTVTSSWVETEPTTGKSTDVGSSDVYLIPLDTATGTVSTVEIVPEGQST